MPRRQADSTKKPKRRLAVLQEELTETTIFQQYLPEATKAMEQVLEGIAKVKELNSKMASLAIKHKVHLSKPLEFPLNNGEEDHIVDLQRINLFIGDPEYTPPKKKVPALSTDKFPGSKPLAGGEERTFTYAPVGKDYRPTPPDYSVSRSPSPEYARTSTPSFSPMSPPYYPTLPSYHSQSPSYKPLSPNMSPSPTPEILRPPPPKLMASSYTPTLRKPKASRASL